MNTKYENIFQKLIYFSIAITIMIITLFMFDKFKNELTNNLYQCEVQFNSNGGSYIDSQKFKCGNKIENYSYPQKDGYTFEGWYIGENKFDFNSLIVEDITLTAKWQEKEIGNNNVSVSKVSISNDTIQMNRSDYLKLSVTIEPSNATNQAVYWKSNNEEIATINEYGIITAKKSGTVTITVTSIDGGYKDTTKLTILSPVTGLKINKEKLIVNVDDTEQLKATTIPIDADNTKLSWTSSDPKIVSVDQKGKIKALAIGKAIITATSVDGGYTSSTEVSVQKLVKKIILNKSSISLDKSKTYTLSYTINPNDATDKTLIWSSSNKNVATVDQNGKVTATGGGVATITVKSNDNQAKSTCKVTVISKVSGVNIAEDNIIIGKGGTKKVTATVIPADSTNKSLNWNSSNSKVVKVDSNGNITGVSDGTATITVETKDGSYKDSCKVTVKDLVLKIDLNKTSANINKGSIYNIKHTISPQTATNKGLTWTSSNPTIATVDQNGKVTALSGGKATITVKSKDGNASSKFTVTVITPLKGITLNKTNLTIQKGKNFNLVVNFNPTDATNKEVTWSSSNNKVATVSQYGKVTGKANGTATITATSKEGNYKATSKVTVLTSVQSIILNSQKIQLNNNKSYQLTATISPADATNKKIVWKSSNPAVATVDQTGKVTTVSFGIADITATATDTNKTASCEVKVIPSGTPLIPTTKKNLYKRITSLGNSKLVMQNFIEVGNYLYVTQRDAYITKINTKDLTQESCINFETYGHMASLDTEVINGQTYIWTGCDGKLNSKGQYTSTKICRIKLTDSLFPKGTSCKKTSASEYIDSSYNYSELNGIAFAIDDKNRLILIRSKVGSKSAGEQSTYTVYDLDSFIKNFNTNRSAVKKLFEFTVKNEIKDVNSQGIEILGNYIYVYEGCPTRNGGCEKSKTLGIFLTVYSLDGTRQNEYRYNIGYPSSYDKYNMEPEGIKIINNNIYAGIYRENKETGRKLFEIYKVEKK